MQSATDAGAGHRHRHEFGREAPEKGEPAPGSREGDRVVGDYGEATGERSARRGQGADADDRRRAPVIVNQGVPLHERHRRPVVTGRGEGLA